MNAVRKFEFERSFDVAVVRHLGVVPPPEPPPAPPPTFSQDELEAARALAMEAGREIGIRETESSIERTLADAVARLADAIERARSDHANLIEAAHRQAADTMFRLAGQLFPSLMERTGTVEIEPLINQALRDGFTQPRLTIRCAAALRDQVAALAAGAGERAGFAGSINVQADLLFTHDDCRIDWAEGGLERRATAAMQAVTATLSTAARTDEPAHPIEESTP